MMEYLYFVTIVGIALWSLVNTLDYHAEMKRQESQQIASNIARMNLRNSDKQFTYDVEPPVGLVKEQKDEYKTKGTQEPTPRIRVAREHYERIIDLADECDMKLIDVLNQLLDFALEHAEVEEIQIPVKSLKVGGEKDGND